MGSKPKAPAAPEDPKIAQERARRLAQQLSVSEGVRTEKFGAGSTVLTGRDISTELDVAGPETTAKGKIQPDVARLEAELEATPEKVAPEPVSGDRPIEVKNVTRERIQREIGTLKAGIGEVEEAEFEEAVKTGRIADLIKRTRKRVGTSRTGA